MRKRLLEGWILIVILFLLLFTDAGRASRKPCRNYRYGSHITAHFDPRNCWDVDEARWKCKDVLFDPQEIKADAR